MTTPSGLARAPSNDVVHTTNWKRLRRRKLAAVPYCEACNAIGRLVPATVVDHVVAVSAGGPMYLNLDQLMSVCAPQNSKTRRVEQGGLPQHRRSTISSGLFFFAAYVRFVPRAPVSRAGWKTTGRRSAGHSVPPPNPRQYGNAGRRERWPSRRRSARGREPPRDSDFVNTHQLDGPRSPSSPRPHPAVRMI
jgi:hypothetical protein